jgi:TolB-like protein
MNRCLVLLALLVTTPAFAQKTLSDGIEDLAQQIAERAKTAHVHRVAVIAFPDLHHEQSDIGAYLAEQLSTSLAIQQVDVVERSLLDRVLGELKLQQTGAIDPESAKRVGKLAGADAIVIGTVTEFQTTLNVTCRVITTETGAVITGARTRITIDSDVETLRKGRAAGGAANTKARPSDTTKSSEHKPSWTGPDVRVTIDKAERITDTITLSIAFELVSNRAGNYQVNDPYLLDENGDRWEGRFENSSQYAFLNLLPQTRVRRWATFRAPQTGSIGTRFTLVAEGWQMALHNIMPTEHP